MFITQEQKIQILILMSKAGKRYSALIKEVQTAFSKKSLSDLTTDEAEKIMDSIVNKRPLDEQTETI